jgi:BirA family biotin operon repressor/biotin-[acetyl-CoA-carboxylase] ligase
VAEEVLLRRLREAAGPLSGAALAKSLKLSRAAVHKRILKLRSAGHRITGVNRLGYRLESLADVFDPSLFAPGWGRPFVHFKETSSTQDEAKERAARGGAPAGALFAADRQTAGRGRLGRRWESPVGGLWYSLVLRPALAPAAVTALALVAAVDWALTLKAVCKVDARVKWPNDVWVGEKKVAGILTEMSSEADRVHWLVLGVGLNVNNAPPAAAASLKGLTGRTWRRQELLLAWLNRFGKSYLVYQTGGFAPFRAAYGKISLLNGRKVSFEGQNGVSSGRAAGVDRLGRLLVKTSGGMESLTAGDVHLTFPKG